MTRLLRRASEIVQCFVPMPLYPPCVIGGARGALIKERKTIRFQADTKKQPPRAKHTMRRHERTPNTAESRPQNRSETEKLPESSRFRRNDVLEAGEGHRRAAGAHEDQVSGGGG